MDGNAQIAILLRLSRNMLGMSDVLVRLSCFAIGEPGLRGWGLGLEQLTSLEILV